jgi:ubiquinone/menaquinone biosynthesis C-methylase UbiE
MSLRDKLETKLLQRLSEPGQTSHLRKWVIDGSKVKPVDKVIDIATGVGGMAFALRELTEQVTAIDNFSERIEIAKADARAHDIDFLATDAGALPFFNEEFDIAFIVLGLHEMGDTGSSRVLREAFRISKRLVVLEFSLDSNPLLWSFLRYPVALFEAPGFLRFTRQNIDTLLTKCSWTVQARESRFPFELFVCDKG